MDNMRLTDQTIDGLCHDVAQHLRKYPGGENGGVSKIQLFKIDPRLLQSLLLETLNWRLVNLEVDVPKESVSAKIADGVLSR